MVVFVLTVGAATFFSQYVNYDGIILYIVYLLLLLMILCVNCDKLADNVIKAVGWSFGFSLIVSVPLIFIDSGYVGGRFVGIFHNANALGSISCIFALISLIYYPGKINFTNTYSNIFFVAVAILCMFLSQSRTSIVAFIATLTIFIIIEKKYKLLWYCIFLIAMLILIWSIIGNLDGFVIRDFTAKTGRELFIDQYYDKFLESPIIGCGLSTENGHGRYKTELAYFDILTYSGLVGFISLMFALVISVYRTLVGCYKTILGNDNKIGYVIIAVLILSIGDGYISNVGNPISLLMWIWFCIYLSRNKMTIKTMT